MTPGLKMALKTTPKTKPHSKHKPARQFQVGTLPTREAIIEAMTARPDLDGKRDLAKYFGIHGDMRTPFKLLLKEMEGEGFIARTRKAIRRTATLPQVTALDIPADADPDDLHAFPAQWNEDEGEKPRVTILVGKNARVVPGPGDRVLARIDAGDGPLPSYTAKPLKILDKPRRGQIGIVRIDEGGARLIPVDRKLKEMRIDGGDLGNARDGDLVEVTTKISGRLMIPKAKVTEVIGNPKSEGAVSMIAIHNLEIPYRFPAAVLREAEEARETSLKGREDWRHIPLITIDPPDAKDHDDAVHAEPDKDPKNFGGHIVTVAIADVAAYVRAGTPLDREAYLRGNSVYFPDRVVPMLPERISNDLCSLKEGKTDRPLRSEWSSTPRGGRNRTASTVCCSAPLPGSATSRSRRQSTDDRTTRPRRSSSRSCSRFTAPTRPWRRRAKNARRSTSTCPSARSSSTRPAWWRTCARPNGSKRCGSSRR